MELIKTIKTTSSTTYIYRKGKKLFAFKPSGNTKKKITPFYSPHYRTELSFSCIPEIRPEQRSCEQTLDDSPEWSDFCDIEKEILANKLAKLFGVRTLKAKPAKINGKKGIITNYMEKSILFANYKKELNRNQIKELKKIILFDIWVGNKDRHTANIFVNDHLIAFDHEKIFSKGAARQFIKLDIGRKLRKDFIDIIEKLVNRKLSIKNALIKLGFKQNDFPKIKREDIRIIVKNKVLLEFLCSRTDFSRIRF